MRNTEPAADVLIGITTSFNEGEQRLNYAYVESIENAGGIPLIVPILKSDQALRSFVRLLHGLVITGGPAVTDGLIGDLPADLNVPDAVRVESDKKVLNAFLSERKPILGICYGMQLLNAASGGTIYGDVERQLVGSLTHSDKRGADVHQVHLNESSHLYGILRKSAVEVNTRHLQAIARIGSPYRVAASAPDGVVEAIENDDGSILGVQFHPERMGVEMQPLFQHLVSNARKIAGSGNLARDLR